MRLEQIRKTNRQMKSLSPMDTCNIKTVLVRVYIYKT